jgi:hypothetical protein
MAKSLEGHTRVDMDAFVRALKLQSYLTLQDELNQTHVRDLRTI